MCGRTIKLLLSTILVISVGNVNAEEACVAKVNSVQIVEQAAGNQLVVYVKNLPVSTYLTYSASSADGGNIETLKMFFSQFLAAQASNRTVCFGYTPSSPAYKWKLNSVIVADEEKFPLGGTVIY